jgi:hypothetical protein
MLQKRQSTDLQVKRATNGSKIQKLDAGDVKPNSPSKKQPKTTPDQDKAPATAAASAN